MLKREEKTYDSNEGDYYTQAFESGKEVILEPYVENSITMTSFAVPIRNDDEDVVGVAGIDITLDELNNLSFTNGGYQTAKFALITNQGQYVVNPDSALVGTNLSEAQTSTDEAAQILEAIKVGEIYTYTGQSDLNGGAESLITFVPINFGNTGTPWSTEVSITIDETMADSTRDGLMMLAAFVLTLMSLFLSIWLVVRLIINRRLKKLVEVADQQAHGNFSIEIRNDYTDELGMVFNSLDAVNDNMNLLLSNLKSVAEQVDAGVQQISASSVALAQGATEQAGSIEELTASMEQISSKTKTNADNAEQANRLAELARGNAQVGNEKMVTLLSAMDGINQSSAAIAGIIKVIDDIAFRTNILALNAAVEAARAGEHGKGFAVVADEVRNLAGKSADAAREIAYMINDSIEKVSDGGRIAEETAKALNDIVNGIENAAKLVNAISVASGEQAASIRQINQGISHVSRVVQANSSTSQETAAASEQLSGQAHNLLQQAAQFTLRSNE